MNTKYKYSVEEITEYDHSETWFESLEQAQLWFDKHVQQALFRLSNLASEIEVNDDDERIIRHVVVKRIIKRGAMKFADCGKVFAEFLLKEYK